MKVSVNDQELFTLAQWEKDVIANDIPTEILDDDMKRRLKWVLTHKFEQCYKRLEKEWIPKLRDLGVSMIPTDPQEFVTLVMARPEYKNRTQRESESQP